MFYLVTKIIRRKEKIEYFYLFITSKGLVGVLVFCVLLPLPTCPLCIGIRGVEMECALGPIGCGREYGGEGGK